MIKVILILENRKEKIENLVRIYLVDPASTAYWCCETGGLHSSSRQKNVSLVLLRDQT